MLFATNARPVVRTLMNIRAVATLIGSVVFIVENLTTATLVMLHMSGVNVTSALYHLGVRHVAWTFHQRTPPQPQVSQWNRAQLSSDRQWLRGDDGTTARHALYGGIPCVILCATDTHNQNECMNPPYTLVTFALP